MSKATDDDERRKRSLEAGREMLERYKAGKASKVQGVGHSQMDEISDEESFHNDKSIGHRESYAHEGVSSRDVTQSSVSMSEGEADGDLEGLAGRVAQLEELLQGKEAIVEALNAEIDHLRAEASSPNSSQSQNSSIHSKDVISLYHIKLQEFEKAVNQRDNLIEDLTWSLQHVLSVRDNLASQLNALNAMEEPCKDNTSAMTIKSLQEKIDTLENTLSDQRSIIQKLNNQLTQNQEHIQTLEMEKEIRTAEINDYKLQIKNLNEQIRLSVADKNLNIAETLEQQKQSVDKIKQDMQHILKKFTSETHINTVRHQQELKDLTAKHEIEIMNIQEKYEERLKQFKDENKILADRLNKELPDLETRHAKELSIFQTQLVHYKKTVEALKLEIMNCSESQQVAQAELNEYKSKLNEFKVQSEKAKHIQNLDHQREKEMLSEQIKLHKLQLEEITSKYIATTAVLESKESIERSLEQALTNAATLKEENEDLKFKLDDLSSRYSAAQSLIENSQSHERTLSNKIYDLEKSLSRFSGINVSTLSELNETTYQTLDEVAIQYQLTKQKLEEKAEFEKRLVQKIENLEEDVRKSKEELEQANLTKKSCEKQLKDMKNICDKYKTELSSLKKNDLKDQSSPPLEEEHKLSSQSMNDTVNDLLHKTEEDQQEIKKLKLILEQKEAELTESIKKMYDLTENLMKSEEEREHLRNGFATLWAQCAEELNQTSALNDSKLDISVPSSSYNSALMKQFKLDRVFNDSVNIIHDQSIDINRTTCEKNEDIDSSNRISSLQGKLTFALQENEQLLKKLQHFKDQQIDYEEIKNKLKHYTSLSENLRIEKEDKMEENRILKKNLENIHSLQESVNQLRSEKDSLRKEIEALIYVHDEQISAIKAETASEIRKVQSLMLGVKEGTTELKDLKTELEMRHAKEMEELRMYFEQKCLLMEKQYSEEIFSQQSKKMSDNDSEIADLTEGLYFGGAGDCLNVSIMSEHSSRHGSPIGDDQSRHANQNFNSYTKSEIEYEINIKALQEELQNKIIEIQEIKLHYEKILEEQKNIYERELYNNKTKESCKLQRNMVNQHCQTEWDAGALENGELTQLRVAYNHQLEEQIALAKLDIVNALQEQIQALLMVESDVEDNWPAELLELRDKLTGNAKKEMQLLKEMHVGEVQHLKEEHSRIVARMIDRHQEELYKIKSEYVKNFDEERDSDRNLFIDHKIFEKSLNKTCIILKTLIEELIKYFIICEEEINSTFINEVVKRKLFNSINNEKILKTDETEESKVNESRKCQETSLLNFPETRFQKLHFAPKITEITSIINNSAETLPVILEKDDNIIENIKQELNNYVHRLKSESIEILSTSFLTNEGKCVSSLKDILWLNKENEELNLKLRHAEDLIISYQEEMDQLKMTILDLQRKLINAENKKETITEGYGENYDTGTDITLQDFSQLQERARHVLSNGGGDCTELLQLIDELCRQSDKLMEEAKKEKEDLQQQQVPLEPTPPTPYIHRVCCRKIEAADKQLKATRRFLDEQASERETERDEAAKQIHVLQEQLTEREREKERDQRITSEVEVLESQMREMSSLMSDTEAKKCETESELKAAIDKIWVLREIITDLEQQVQIKTEKEESLQLQINQLETVIAAQTKNQHELVQELDAVKMGSESKQLNEHIIHLQEELKKHKLSSEQFSVNSTVLKQMKTELRDMQNQLDKRIKELESAHMCSSNLSLSQPSEDVSIRDQIDASRCPTPDDPTAPPMLPLDHLLKLKEKMSKHSRVEEVILKRIKDLELQVTALKNQNEELQAEQEILQQTNSEQLFQIEVMRGRLEQQKQSAPFAQRQATSRLELQLHEANIKFQSLERTIADKNLELKDIKNQLDRVNQLLQEKEAEIANVVQVKSATIQKLKEHLEVIEEEKKILQTKVGVQEHAQLELPRLIDSILADKNEEIDHLKEQLSKKEKQLEMYSSLNLDETQLRELARQTEAKNSARTLSDILSIHSECEETTEAIRGANTIQNLPNVSVFKVNTLHASQSLDNSVVPLTDTANVVLQVPPLDLGSQSLSASSSQQCGGLDLLQSDLESKTSSSEKNFSCNKTDYVVQSRQECTQMQESLEKESTNEKNESSNNRSYVTSIKYTQTSINETLKEVENLENQLKLVKEELDRKSAILIKREADLIALQKLYDELQMEFKDVAETLSRDKCFYQNQYELSQVSENKIKQDLQEIENVLKLRNEEMQDHKNKMQVNERIIMELNLENTKLKKDIEEKEQEQEQTRKYTTLLQEKIKEFQNSRDIILEKDNTIKTTQTPNNEIENENNQLYEFKTMYQSTKQELLECQNEIQRLTEGLNNRDQIIRRLEEMARRTSFSGTSSPSNEKDQEIHHLQEFVKQKDNIIREMIDDSKRLYKALEAIRNKMRESGNVVELRKKLEDERKLNVELLKTMAEKLNKELSDLKLPTQRSQDDTDIEDMVQRELNLSAHLDRQIMNAIENDTEVKIKVDRQVPYQDYQGGRYMELKLKLSDKINEELKKLKDDLEIEREMLRFQIAEYESRIFQLKSDLTEESKKVAKLDEELSSEKNLVRTLKIQIEKEHRAMQCGHNQDIELIEFLQSKLKTSLDNETKLRDNLSLLRQEHKSLEIQLSLMKNHMQTQKVDDLPRLTDLLEIERKKYLSAMDKFEKEERNNAELKDTLQKLQMEKTRFEKQFEVEVEKKEKLISSLALIEGIKDHLQTDLKRTKEDLKAREEECEWLQKRIKTMSDAEIRRQEQRTSEYNELRALRREINNAREVMMDLEADMKQSKRELTESLEREVKLAKTLEALKERESDLLKKLSVTKDEEKKLRDMITELQQEVKTCTRRELELTKELKSRFTNENMPGKLIQNIKDLSDMNEKYVTEKTVLREKLITAREEKEQLNQRIKLLESQVNRSKGPQNPNTMSLEYMKKLKYFYGMYLRAHSRHRALIYQKRYLLTIVGSYQLSEENTLSVLAQLTKEERSYAVVSRNRKSPKVRFRSAVFVLISIHRMKWLILRWNTEKRIGVKTLLWNMDQSFIPFQKTSVNHSPPVRDKSTSNGNGGFDGFALEQYYQRLMNIQTSLGLTMVEAGNLQIIPE